MQVLAGAMRMRVAFDLDRHKRKPAVTHAALGDDFLGETAHIGGCAP